MENLLHFIFVFLVIKNTFGEPNRQDDVDRCHPYIEDDQLQHYDYITCTKQR